MRGWACILALGAIGVAQEERLTAPTIEKKTAPPIVEGRILDGQTGEPLPGVLVRLGAGGTYTDARGTFSLPFQAETLTVFLQGYRTVKMPLTRPLSEVYVRLYPIETELEAVQIIADAARETEVGIFLQRLRSLEIGEVYSQELIMKRSTDFYVPNVLRRLPGVSLLSGRYVTLRGMGERYNAFAFWAAYPAWVSYDASFGELEQLITNLLGKVEVRKFWTPELLGHFGGGMVDFQFPSASSSGLQVAYTAEVDLQAVGRPFARFRTPLRDPISSDFPSPNRIIASENSGRPTAENFTYGRQVQRYTIPDTMEWAPPGGLLTLAYDYAKEKWRFSLRGAFSRRHLRSLFEFNNGNFIEEDGSWRFEPVLFSTSRSSGHSYSQGGGFSYHVSLQPTPAHTFTIEGIALGNTYQRCILDESYYINPDIDSTQFVYSYYPSFLTQRSFFGVVRPGWTFRRGGWQAGVQSGFILQHQHIPQSGAMNYVRYPGTTEVVYEQELYNESEIYAQVWTSRVQAHQLYVHPYLSRRWERGERWIEARIGGWVSQELQRFRGRQLGFMTDTAGGGPNVLDPAVYALENIRAVYSPEHIRPGGWYLIERTGDFHRHAGQTRIYAGYAWLRSAFHPNWEILLGGRYEAWQRTIQHIPIATETAQTFLRLTDAHFLPSFLLKYRLSEYQALRGGVSLSLIRPPLPSQVPLPYFDYLWAYYWIGDSTLRTGRSYNAELRYEWLKDKDNLIAVGVFYKQLRNLPEVYLVPASFNLVFTYSTRQREWGDVFGIEVESRRTLWQGEKARIWSYLTLTISESGLEQSVWRKIGRLDGRLQGHAPIVGNTGLLYTRPRWEAAVFANYTAPQIWAIGFDPYVYPHLVEEGRWIAEGQVSYRLGERWEVRLAIWDLINQPYRRTQRVGNANAFEPDRDALSIWEQQAYRFYVTLRYKLSC